MPAPVTHHRRPISSTVERVAGQLRDMIAEDELRPGDRLRERDLATLLNVSRTPLREALRLLAAEGIVDLSANRGAAVASPDPDEIHDLLQVLGVLEALAGEQAAERAGEAQIGEVRAIHYEMLAAFERHDRMAYYKHNQDIHLAIVAASRNAALIESHRRTNARLYRVRYLSHQRQQRWREAVGSHDDILAALSERDGTTLATLLREHQVQAWENIVEQSSDTEAASTCNS
jgi:DNA-binding GntR family transcriptional regulator